MIAAHCLCHTWMVFGLPWLISFCQDSSPFSRQSFCTSFKWHQGLMRFEFPQKQPRVWSQRMRWRSQSLPGTARVALCLALTAVMLSAGAWHSGVAGARGRLELACPCECRIQRAPGDLVVCSFILILSKKRKSFVSLGSRFVFYKHLCCVALVVSASLWPYGLCIASQAPLLVEFSMQELSSGVLPPPGDLTDPGIEPKSLMSPALAGRGGTMCGIFFVTLDLSPATRPRPQSPSLVSASLVMHAFYLPFSHDPATSTF